MKVRRKIIVFTSIFLSGTILSANLAFAQLVGVPTVEGPGPLLTGLATVITNTASTALGVGNGATQAGIAAALGTTLDAVCKGITAVGNGSAIVDQSLSNFSLIGGSPAMAASLDKQIASLIALQSCRKAQLDTLKKTTINNLLMGQEVQRRQDDLTKEIYTISQRVENLRAQFNASVTDVLKAVAIKLVLTASKKLTTIYVNKLVAKYKIGNYLKYADALATQVYDIDYIHTNYPQKQDQMILASIIKNIGFQNDVLPYIRQQTKDALGFVPEQLTFSDPNYYVKMAQAGSGQADPYFMQTVFNDKAKNVQAQSRNQAQNEIASGKGFIAPRDCQDVTNQQKQIDQQNITLSYQVDFNRQVLQRLQNSGKASQKDFAEAQSQLDASTKALKALPQALPEIMAAPCKAINNPGAFMGDTIQNFLNKHLTEAGNVKTENIPFWGTFLEGVADNLVTNVIQGGRSTVGILTEAGIQATNIAANDIVKNIDDTRALKGSTETTANDQNKVSNGGVLFRFANSDPSGVPAGTYVLNWDASDVEGAKYVVLTGDLNMIGIQSSTPVAQLQGVGQVNFILPGSYSFMLQVLDANKKVLKTVEMTMKIIVQTIQSNNSSTLSYIRGNGGQVAGAFTQRAVVAVRGPALSIRGD